MNGPARPSHPGLAGERTSLAWTRTGLTLLAFPGAVLAYATSGGNWLVLGAAGAALALGLLVVTLSLRRQRARPGFVGVRDDVLAAPLVAATAASVLLLALASLALVLGG